MGTKEEKDEFLKVLANQDYTNINSNEKDEFWLNFNYGDYEACVSGRIEDAEFVFFTVGDVEAYNLNDNDKGIRCDYGKHYDKDFMNEVDRITGGLLDHYLDNSDEIAREERSGYYSNRDY